MTSQGLTRAEHGELNKLPNYPIAEQLELINEVRARYPENDRVQKMIDIYDPSSEYSKKISEYIKAKKNNNHEQIQALEMWFVGFFPGLPPEIHGELYQISYKAGTRTDLRFAQLRKKYVNDDVARQQIDMYDFRTEYVRKILEYRDILKKQSNRVKWVYQTSPKLYALYKRLFLKAGKEQRKERILRQWAYANYPYLYKLDKLMEANLAQEEKRLSN